MKAVILSGSPKGDLSVTLQYLKYIQKKFPEEEYRVFNIGKDIKRIEKDKEYFSRIIEEIRKSDAVVWLTPVFFLLVPSQVKRFVELVFENKANDAFNGKYVTSITTSIKYFDFTAHNYLRGISEDMGAKYVEGLTLKMDDLFDEAMRDVMAKFWKNFLNLVSSKLPAQRLFEEPSGKILLYDPGDIKDTAKTEKAKITLLHDAKEEDLNLSRMLDVFLKLIPCNVEAIDINKADIKGGCLSCYNCAPSNICAYKDVLQA